MIAVWQKHKKYGTHGGDTEDAAWDMTCASRGPVEWGRFPHHFGSSGPMGSGPPGEVA